MTQQGATDAARAPVWVKAFLSKLRMEGNVTQACKAAKIERSTAYRHKETDEAFEAEWRAALDEAADRLEAEAWRRAYRGVKKPVYQQKELVGHIQEYSDTLMVLLLKAHKPDKFRERTDVTSGGEKVAIAVVKMDTDEL